MQTILVINSGSSSIKYQLLDPTTHEVFASGLVEQIGEPSGAATHKNQQGTFEYSGHISDHIEGMNILEKMFAEHGPQLEDTHIVGVGHRVVQGGEFFDGPALIDEKVHQLIIDLCPLAPLHNPAHLKGIDAAKQILSDVPHVAVFDTAFFQHLPTPAATYALNQEVARKYQIRRYGAHGTSHRYVSGIVSEFLGRKDIRQIVLHIGNGASASAVVNGEAVDTSMGLTPLEGLVMGTRCGDLDPAVVFHLSRQAGMSIEQIDTLMNKESGLKGICGSNDMREVRAAINAGSAEAKLAFEVYIHRLVKYVGAYAAVMGGLDALSFTAGVGENDALVREAVCGKLAFLGVKLDVDKNTVRSSEIREISAADSGVKVLVAPTNEELAIAQQTFSII